MLGTVVALHGFTGTPKTLDSLDLHGPGHLVVRPWLEGHGPSPRLTARDFRGAVRSLLASLRRHPKPWHVVGYSMGARVALGLLLEQPDAFASALLIGLNPGLRTEREREARLTWEARLIDILEQDGVATFEHHWSQLGLFENQRSLPPALREAQREARLCHTAPGLVHAIRTLGLGSMPSHWRRLRRLEFPVALLVGQKDEKFLQLAKETGAKLRDARVVVVPDAGHNLVLEAPTRVREEWHALLAG